MGKEELHICLICVEIFAWGKYGGFGRATRLIGRELVKRGVRVTAVVPRRQDQKPEEILDGIRVLSFGKTDMGEQYRLYKEIDADVYHSEEPSFGTFLAQQAMPHKKHMITFRDPRRISDWLTEFRLPSLSRAQVLMNILYEDNFLVHHAARHADARYAAAHLLKPIVVSKYGLKTAPTFLPTPVPIPDHIEKSSQPTVCLLGRLDRRKRPEIFFDLAATFPRIRFIAAGRSRDPEWDQELHQRYGGLPNVEMMGFLDQFDGNAHTQVLQKSWVLVNTSAREGLPNAFLEATANKCAILSEVDPDGFASRFGYHAAYGDFGQGLKALLGNDLWRERAAAGYAHVKAEFSLEAAIDQHLAAYHRLNGAHS